MSNSNNFVIFKQHLAGWLMMQGFVLLAVSSTDKENSKRNVFVFKKTKALLSMIEEYKKLHNN